MFDIVDKPKLVERALLVGVCKRNDDINEANDLLRELEELVDTMGVPVLARQLVLIREPQSRYFMGEGKAQEIIDTVKEQELDCIIFDNELTPAQQKNWEALSGVCVIDRQEVILDIFSNRAQTKEARLQVELARLQYNMPRLTRAWAHLGKQGGGIGTKGEGESQLELDKRMIRQRIDKVKSELVLVKKRRATQRKKRQRTPVPNVAVVGYTNAGKSSLLKKLADADVLVEDKLFATLDTTTRKIELHNNQPLLLTDTVGFVRRLPHQLVEAFNATLEEAVQATFLIHLLDVSQPRIFEFHQTTEKVLKDLGAGSKTTLTVFNKIDRVEDPSILQSLRLHFPEALFISVKKSQGFDELLHQLAKLVGKESSTLYLKIPHTESASIARLHREANVHNAHYKDHYVEIHATIPLKILHDFKDFTLNPENDTEITIKS